MVAKLVLIIPSFVVYWKGVMHVFNSQVCDQVEQILMEFGKAPEQGYMLNQLRSHRFHHTIINGFFFLSLFFPFFFFFFFAITVSPFHPSQNSPKTQSLPWGFGFVRSTAWSHPHVKPGQYTSTSQRCWKLIRQWSGQSSTRKQHVCACVPCLFKLYPTWEPGGRDPRAFGFARALNAVQSLLSQYKVSIGGIKMSAPFQGFCSLKRLQKSPQNEWL